MIKLYLWEMTPSNFGHLSLELSDRTYISFWPKDEGWFKGKSVGISKEADIEMEGSPSATLELPDEIVNQEKIRKWWSGYVDNHMYNFVSNNCAQVVQDALVTGGILHNEHFTLYKRGPSPREVFDWVKARLDDYIAKMNLRPAKKTCLLM